MCWGLEDQSYALAISTSLLLETEVSCFQDESGEPEDMTSNVPPKALQCHKSPSEAEGQNRPLKPQLNKECFR